MLPTHDDQLLVRMAGITKRFGRVTVLRDVPFDVHSGEVHVLAGENGAGKSTLIKILAGAHSDFAGAIEIEGRRVRPRSPLDAARLGIAVIHQELSLIGSMSVADNIYLGRTPTRQGGLVRDAQQREQSRHWIQRLGIDLNVTRAVDEFPIATQQLIEVAKALSQNAKVIIMDEPTSALNAPEVERLFALIDRLKSEGRGIVYITHKMEEIQRLADRITVLRDGRHVSTVPAAELPVDKLIQLMVGRQIQSQFRRRLTDLGDIRVRAENFSVYPHGLSSAPSVQGVSLSIRAGEIVGIGGLQGSGASDLLMGLFGGYARRTRGHVQLDGQSVSFRTPRQAIDAGVALLTNDRKANGLVLSLSVTANATLAALPQLSPGGLRRPRQERAATESLAKTLHLRAASLENEVETLSGGNQQKVALAKWLQTRPRLLLLDEPTRGVDVGAKREIYQMINDWTSQGIAILLITSELPELLALSDRLIVLHRGRVTTELSRHEATPERVLSAAMGTKTTESEST